MQLLAYLATCNDLPEYEDGKTSCSSQRNYTDDYSQHDHPRCDYNRRLF